MNEKFLKVTLKYIAFLVLVVIVVISLNYGMLIYFGRHGSYEEPTEILKTIALELSKSEEISLKSKSIIINSDLWVQLVDNDGQVIYSFNEPRDINQSYSLKDIAILSKSYLEDYPVFLWESNENIVILGYPKNSISKYN